MENNKNLTASEGLEKLKELVNAINICLFSTNLQKNDGATFRPMSAQEVDEDVQLVFSDPIKSSYLIVNGVAEIVVDRHKIEELWSPAIKIWFEKGKEDPNISLIKVKTQTAFYWDTEVNKMINFFKYLASVATGSNLTTSVKGSIKV